MRYTQYTHKVSIPMRKELYDFLQSLPRGARTDLGREFFLRVQAMLCGRADWCARGTDPWRKDFRRLCRGEYNLELWNDEEEEDET